MRIQYPLSYNPIIEYYSLIESGKEIVSEKVRRIYKKLVSDIGDKESIYVHYTSTNISIRCPHYKYIN